MKLKTVKIERFKRLEKINFDADDINVLIGGNNSGKSTIIQAIHFAFTLLQSLTISNKWPAAAKKSSTISPSELIYIPSEDPYSLGFGGRLLEDEARSIIIIFGFDNGEEIKLAIRKGRITNIIVEPENIEFAKTLSRLEAPFSVFSPGLAGVSRTENYVSDGVLLRVLARGDANIVLRNILFRLHQKGEWSSFSDDLSLIFPSITLSVKFEERIDQYIDVKIAEGGREVPLDLAGTGLLQAVQILAYLHLFAPKLIVLDEPDSHLHPNNQRLLCSLLRSIAVERDVQVIMTTHSRHVLDSMYSDATLLWVHNGEITKASADDEVDILLELGALDVKERIATGKFKVVILTEDSNSLFLTTLAKNSGFNTDETLVLPYNGITSPHLLKPLIRQIKAGSKITIIVHRDRDFLSADEVEDWKKTIRAAGAEPFITENTDIEDYFCSDDYIRHATKGQTVTIEELKEAALKGQTDEIIASYVNGRIDIARKTGTLGKVDLGKLSASAASAVSQDAWAQMKGKRKLARLRNVCRETFGFDYKIDHGAPIPTDQLLAEIAQKNFKKR